jgi:hypothetical protein
MNIIFGNKHNLDNKHIILELDTIRVGTNGPEQTAYCVVENVPLQEMSIVESLKESHQTLMTEYRSQNWSACEQIIEQLTGMWGGEVDTFYEELLRRISILKTQTLDESWTGIIEKN